MGVLPAHLVPYKFTSKTSPGRGSAGKSLVEWRNKMRTWSEQRIRKVADDPTEPAVKRTAAREWLVALRPDFVDKVGRIDPEPGKIRQKMEERSMGKPLQSVDLLAQTVQRSPAEAIQQLTKLVQSNVLVRDALRAALASPTVAADTPAPPDVTPPLDGAAVQAALQRLLVRQGNGNAASL